MKTIIKMIVVAFLCLILTPVFAGTQPKSGDPTVVPFKKILIQCVKIKRPHTTSVYYADIYLQESGTSIEGGVTVTDLKTYAELVDDSGNTVIPGIQVNVNLVILLGPPGDNTQTPIQYQIPPTDYHSTVLSGWTQRSFSGTDIVSVSCSPSSLGSIPIDPSGPYSF